MNSVSKIILSALVGILISGIFTGAFYWGTKYQKQKDQILQSKLVEQVESLQRVIKVSEGRVTSLVCERDSLTVELISTQKSLKSIEKKYNEKISNITAFGNAELEQFFSNRYN